MTGSLAFRPRRPAAVGWLAVGQTLGGTLTTYLGAGLLILVQEGYGGLNEELNLTLIPLGTLMGPLGGLLVLFGLVGACIGRGVWLMSAPWVHQTTKGFTLLYSLVGVLFLPLEFLNLPLGRLLLLLAGLNLYHLTRPEVRAGFLSDSSGSGDQTYI